MTSTETTQRAEPRAACEGHGCVEEVEDVNAAPKIAAALEAAKGSVTALDALWEQDCDYEPTKWGRNINCARCDEGVRGFHDDTAHWADIKHKGDCIYAYGRALREALAALDGGAP